MQKITKKIISILIVSILFVSNFVPCIWAFEEPEIVEEVEQKDELELEENETTQSEDIETSEEIDVLEDNEESNNETIDEIKDNESQNENETDSIKEDNIIQNEETEETNEEPEIKDEEIQQVKLTYSAHVENIGWQKEVENNEIAGTQGKSYRLEALKINLETELEGEIQYSTHIQNIGWQGYVTNGELSGTTGKSYRLEAIKIRLTGELAQKYDIYYRTHIQSLGWLDWAKNGEKAGTQNYSYRMEAIQINLVEKGTEINISEKSFYNKPILSYRTHIQDIGWQGYVNDGKVSGTSGQSKRLEAIKIKIGDTNLSGSIQYSTHIQNIGWQDYVEAGKISGTEGKCLRLEAIKINLTGELKDYYNIYYRTHVENMGWLAWAKNGEEAGTEGYSYRLEAIQIQLVPKKESAPGNTSGHFYNKALEKKSIEGIKLVFGNVCAGVDVSEHNGNINWKEVKNVANFAIIRCGYGQNIASQDDKQFEANMQKCILNKIPVEVYLYSYADTVGKASSEADHVLRLCNKYKSNIRKIWYDVEDNSVFNQITSGALSKDNLGQIIDTFSNRLKASGYNVGVYTYSYALNNYFPSNVKDKYEIWIANYPGTAKDVFEATYSLFRTIYEMWQFTSSGGVNGIKGNVDLNIRF